MAVSWMPILYVLLWWTLFIRHGLKFKMFQREQQCVPGSQDERLSKFDTKADTLYQLSPRDMISVSVLIISIDVMERWRGIDVQC